MPGQKSRTPGFTLIELLVVVSIIGLLASLLSPALSKSKQKSQQSQCLNNLKQIGIALALYKADQNEINAPHRLCPDTLDDPYGLTSPVPSGTSPNNPPPTGPNEIWWAPYDPTQTPDGPSGAGYKRGLLFPYVGTTNTFKCPVEPTWQCSYGMNYSTGSPMGQSDSIVERSSEMLVVWDHRRSPGCSDSRILLPPRAPWLPFDNTSHYPPRHNGALTGLFHDGHAASIHPRDLRLRNFRSRDSLPAIADYPGE